MFVFKIVTTVLISIIMLILLGTFLTQDMDKDAQAMNKLVFGLYAMSLIAMWG